MNRETIKKKIKETISKEIKSAEVILFGSKARGTDTKESDWDILVLIDQPEVTFKDEQSVRHKLYDVELEVEEPFSTFVYSTSVWNSKMKETPFYKNVKKEGIYL